MGWFIWFRKGNVSLAIDVFTDDPDEGGFRIHLTSRTKRLLLFESMIDTPDLEGLLDLVHSELKAWGASGITVAQI